MKDEEIIFKKLVRAGYFDHDGETFEENYEWIHVYVTEFGFEQAESMILDRKC